MLKGLMRIFQKKKHGLYLKELFRKYHEFTMIPKDVFINNLLLTEKFRS